MDIIDLNHIDFDIIKQDLDNYLKKLDTFSDIQETIPASTIDLIERVASSYAVYLAQKLRRTREEFYLSTATLDTSIYNFAYMFGYNINRFTAPQIQVKYLGRDTISLSYGEVIGTYGDKYEVIYTGRQKKYEQGDILESISIGIINSITKNKEDFSTIEKVTINPEHLKSVNNQIALFIDGTQQGIISRNPEDYLINRQATEFSNTKFSTIVYVFDKDSNFGIDPDNIQQNYTIKWVETDGYDPDFDINKVSLNNEDFIVLDVAHLGTYGDSLLKVKNLIPYYYHTLRRAVTLKDYTYIALANPLFKDVYFKREEGVKGIKRIKIVNSSNLQYNVIIYGTLYTISVNNEDSLSVRYERIYNAIKNNTLIKASYTDNYVEIENVNTRLDFDKNVSVDASLSLENVRQNVKPICCTLLCYYIKYNTIDDPIIFTDKEQSDLSDYFMQYQMAGTNIIFLPAQKIEKDLKLLVKVDKTADIDLVKDEIKSLISEYELQLRKNFYYGELLAKIGAISQVLFVLPQQEPFDIEIDGKNYLKFNTEIEIEVMG